MNTASLLHFFHWWIRKLVNAVLRPMFCRYRKLQREGLPFERYERLFWGLLYRCDCSPFCVEADPYGLWILDVPSERDFYDEFCL